LEVSDPVLVVLGLGRWPALREAVACVLHHAAMMPKFHVRLITDWPELAEPLKSNRIEVVESPSLPEPRECCGVGTFYEGRAHYFGLKIEVVGLLAGESLDRAILLDSDAAALSTFEDLELAEGKHVGFVRDRYRNPLESYEKPKQRFATPEEWESMRSDGSLSINVPTFNTGLILLRPGNWLTHFAATWLADWRRFRNSDQQPLSRILLRPALVAGVEELPLKYNRFCSWQMQRPNPKVNENVAPIDRLAAEGELVVAHNHDVAVSIYRRSGAWDRAPELLRSAGARPGMKGRT
jgi:hypothetical protein